MTQLELTVSPKETKVFMHWRKVTCHLRELKYK